MADTATTNEKNNPILTNVVPWGLHPVPDFVRNTLKKRAKSYAWHSINAADTEAVRTAWARVCSNGKVAEHGNLDGFILNGPNTNTISGQIGFDEQFGFGADGKQIIGRDVNNIPHTLTPITFPHRPPPAMLSIETEFYGAGSSFPGLCKKATVKWKCFSMEQLEYITPYFLSLGVTAVIEWGWNNFSVESLLDLRDSNKLLEMFAGGKSYYERISASGGDYDCHVGRVIDYGYTMDNQGNYEGYTVVVNPSFMLEGVNIKDQTGITVSNRAAASAKEFIKNKFDNLVSETDDIFYGKESVLWRAIHKNKWIFKKPREKYPEIEPNVKFWINMRAIQAIFNLFGSIRYTTGANNLVFRFSNTKIGAHPLIKAVCAGSDNKNVNVLIPNANAPRLMRKMANPSRNSLKTIVNSTMDNQFKSTAESLSTALGALEFTDDVDNLQYIIGSKNPFPMLVGGGLVADEDPSVFGPSKKSPSGVVDTVYACARPGYWGFLGDIYISNNLVKTAFEQNDTLQRTLEYILGEISSAGSNFWEFRVIPDGPSDITVFDTSFCPVSTGKDCNSANIVNFEIGRTEDSCFTEYGMNVQMKQEMATQTLLGNNSAVDAKGKIAVSRFMSGDRLYKTPGSFEYAVEETSDEKKSRTAGEVKKAKQTAKDNAARETDKGFVILQQGDDKYYLVEKNPEIMKKIVALGERGDSSKTLSTPMMPGTEFTFDCQGISGFAFLGMFTLSAVPKPYNNKNAVFQIDGVKNIISENNWKTSITAKVRPLVSAASPT